VVLAVCVVFISVFLLGIGQSPTLWSTPSIHD